MTPHPKNLKVKFIKNYQNNESKEQYVDYFFNNTSQIFCFTEERNSILCSKGKKLDFSRKV